MGGTVTAQLALIAGLHRCDNCERTVERVRSERGYWLCDACFAAIVPAEGIDLEAGQRRDADWHAATQGEREKIAAYFRWRRSMEQRKPLPVQAAVRPQPAVDAGGDEDWPLCACGQLREPMRWVPPGRKSAGLFGGPYRQHCKVCEIKLRVQAHHDMLRGGVNHEWDDEQWLDSLEQIMPAAFELGVLPDYWFRLRRPEMFEGKP